MVVSLATPQPNQEDCSETPLNPQRALPVSALAKPLPNPLRLLREPQAVCLVAPPLPLRLQVGGSSVRRTIRQLNNQLPEDYSATLAVPATRLVCSTSRLRLLHQQEGSLAERNRPSNRPSLPAVFLEAVTIKQAVPACLAGTTLWALRTNRNQEDCSEAVDCLAVSKTPNNRLRTLEGDSLAIWDLPTTPEAACSAVNNNNSNPLNPQVACLVVVSVELWANPRSNNRTLRPPSIKTLMVRVHYFKTQQDNALTSRRPPKNPPCLLSPLPPSVSRQTKAN